MYSSERRPAAGSPPISAASTPQRSGATPSSAAARAAASLLQRLARGDAAQQAQAADEVAALCASASAIGGGDERALLDLLSCQGVDYALLRAAGDLVRSADAGGAVPAARAAYGALAALMRACGGGAARLEARLDVERDDAEALIAALQLPNDGVAAAAANFVAALQRVRGSCSAEAECSASVAGFCDPALSDALAGALLHVAQTQPVDGAGPLTCLGVLCDWLVGLTRDGEGASSPALAASVRHAVMHALRSQAPAALVAGARLLQAASMQAEVNDDEPLAAELHAMLRDDGLLDALLGILEARSAQPGEVQYAVLEALHLLLQPASDAAAQHSAAALPRLAAYMQRRPPPPCFAAASAIASATSYFRRDAARADAFCKAGGLAALVQLLEHALAARDGYEDAPVPMGACVSGEEEDQPFVWHHSLVAEAARALQQLAKEAVPGMQAAMLKSGAAAALSDVLQRSAGRAAAFDADDESIDGICTRFEVSQLSAAALALLHLCDQGGSEMRAAFRDAGGLDALCSALHRRTQPHETWDVLSALAAAVAHEPLSQAVVCEPKTMRVLVRLIAAPDATVAVFRLLQVLFDGGAASRAAFCECAGAAAVSQELLQFHEHTTAVPAVALLRALCADPGGCSLLYDSGAVPALLGAVFDGGVARDAALDALAALVSGSPKAAEEVLSTELQPVMEVLMVCLKSVNSQGASLEDEDENNEGCSSSGVRTPGGDVSSADETVNRDTPVAADGHADASDEVEELRAQITAMTTQMATLKQMQSVASSVQSTASPAQGRGSAPAPAQLSWAYAAAIAATAFSAALVVAPLLSRATRRALRR